MPTIGGALLALYLRVRSSAYPMINAPYRVRCVDWVGDKPTQQKCGDERMWCWQRFGILLGCQKDGNPTYAAIVSCSGQHLFRFSALRLSLLFLLFWMQMHSYCLSLQ